MRFCDVWRLSKTNYRCDSVTLADFVKASNGNLKALRKRSGFWKFWGLWASEKTLKEAYLRLINEYIELCEEKNEGNIEAKKLLILRLQVIQLEALIDIQNRGGNVMDDILDLCNAYSMTEAKGVLAEWTMLLETTEKRLEKFNKEASKEEGKYKIGKLIAAVCKHQGHQIDRKTTTVAELAEYVVGLKEYIKQNEIKK